MKEHFQLWRNSTVLENFNSLVAQTTGNVTCKKYLHFFVTFAVITTIFQHKCIGVRKFFSVMLAIVLLFCGQMWLYNTTELVFAYDFLKALRKYNKKPRSTAATECFAFLEWALFTMHMLLYVNHKLSNICVSLFTHQEAFLKAHYRRQMAL